MTLGASDPVFLAQFAEHYALCFGFKTFYISFILTSNSNIFFISPKPKERLGVKFLLKYVRQLQIRVTKD